MNKNIKTSKLRKQTFSLKQFWGMFKYEKVVLYFDLRPEQNAIQGDAPEGSDTFHWQLCEEIAWAEIGWWNGTS